MLKPLLPLMVYYANYDYIVTELCENRDKPYLECNGRCYLEALQKRVEPIRNTNPVTTVPLNMNDYPISTLDFYVYKSLFSEDINILSAPNFWKHFVITKYSFSIFHPPKYVA
jgi:hypothetical protein